MSDATDEGVQYHQREFWDTENLRFSEPHYRSQKAVRIITKIARKQGRDLDLLDVGCGPAALMHQVPPGIRYHGIDIAIHDPAPNLREADLVKDPIGFDGKQFDIVIAQGVFEYLPGVQAQRFAEVAEILKPGGTFIVTYWNYAHHNAQHFHAHRNVQPIAEFRAALAQHFRVDRSFPASHNWQQTWPNRPLIKTVNMHLNAHIPVISTKLAVEYFFLCSPRPKRFSRRP